MSHTVQFKHWDQALKDFLANMQLTQALRGFENDMLVLNPDWETKTVPLAMAKFLRTLVAMNTTSGGVEPKPGEDDKMDVDADMDERKLAYVRPSNGGKPQSPTSTKLYPNSSRATGHATTRLIVQSFCAISMKCGLLNLTSTLHHGLHVLA